jgi:hypothetical protein
VRCIDALGHGDDVGRAAGGADFGDGFKDQPVRGREEQVGVETGDLVNEVRLGHEASEYGALGGGRLGHGARH